ncbi:MAG: glycosyltransferase family 39 protein [Anaerolineales bacterium]
MTRISLLNLTPAKLAVFLLLVLILISGAFLRFSDLTQPLLDFHPTRQLFSAVKARGMYYQTLPDAPARQKDLSYRQWQREATIEPPIVENIAVFFYNLSGEESTAYPRAVSATFWMLASIFLGLLAFNLTGSVPAAIFSVGFFLLIPYGIPASRAFQPDPLMVLLIILSWCSIQQWAQKNSWNWAILAGLAGGFAIFIKLPAVFFVAGGVIGVILAYSNMADAIKNSKTWLIALLCMIPPAAYLYYGLYVAGFLGQQFGGRFFPGFWLDPYFYLRWLLKADFVIGVFWLCLAVLGWLIFAAKPARIFLSALWGGYFVYGLVFPHHIASHDYYSLPLIPITALSLAPLVAIILPRISSLFFNRYALNIFFLSAYTFVIIYSITTYLDFRRANTRQAAQAYAEIGQVLQHQPGITALTEEYGYPLAYYGWQNVSIWWESPDFEQAFAEQTFRQAYFLVTDFAALSRQPQLAEKLQNYTIFAQTREYIIYDLKAPLP